MSRPGIGEGMGVAFIAALLAALSSMLVDINTTAAGLTLLYLLYLLTRSSERVGRIVVVTSFVISVATAWLLGASPTAHLILVLASIWIVRALYYYQSALLAMADLSLVVLGVAAFAFAWQSTQSFGLATWSFFLVQALFTFLPDRLITKPQLPETTDAARTFEAAHDSARAAVRALATNS